MTTAHILKLVQLGGYNGNHFFRIDKGFVAQTASVVAGRHSPLEKKQQVDIACAAAYVFIRDIHCTPCYEPETAAYA